MKNKYSLLVSLLNSQTQFSNTTLYCPEITFPHYVCSSIFRYSFLAPQTPNIPSPDSILRETPLIQISVRNRNKSRSPSTHFSGDLILFSAVLPVCCIVEGTQCWVNELIHSCHSFWLVFCYCGWRICFYQKPPLYVCSRSHLLYFLKDFASIT